MSLAIWFWLLLVLWVVLSGASASGWSARWGAWGNSVLLLLILVVLGIHAFGSPIK